MRNHIVLLLLLFSLLPVCASAESLSLAEMAAAEDAASLSSDLSAPETVQTVSTAAREDFIDRILSLAQTLYTKANGQPQRAQYSGDIYVCKNYTVHLFRETCGDFRMAEYPDVPLVIPNNQKKADCAPYVYGVEWQDVPASEGNPFYSQIRVGQTHRDGSLSTFRMWKFRSMYKDADERLAELKEQNDIAGAMFKMRDDPRVTKIGKFIRKHSIDEFPQFLNVFLGQMSVVGPRPPLPNEVAEYTEFDLQRLAVKPGITGWWQVTERNSTGFDGMVRRDLEYIAKRGPITDLKIVVLTVIEVITGKGAC